jgi:hypothetical protein
VNLGLPWLFASKEQQDVDPQQEHVAVSLGRFVSLITQFLSLKNMFQKSKKSVFWGRFPSVFFVHPTPSGAEGAASWLHQASGVCDVYMMCLFKLNGISSCDLMFI